MTPLRLATLSLGAALLLAACKDTTSAGTDVPSPSPPPAGGTAASTDPPRPDGGGDPGAGGTVPAPDSTYVECTPDTRKGGMCTREYRPVCGQKAENTFQTYPNPCNACSDVAVQRYRLGACEAAGAPQ